VATPHAMGARHNDFRGQELTSGAYRG
jgi:hypothetical protein